MAGANLECRANLDPSAGELVVSSELMRFALECLFAAPELSCNLPVMCWKVSFFFFGYRPLAKASPGIFREFFFLMQRYGALLCNLDKESLGFEFEMSCAFSKKESFDFEFEMQS